MRRAAILMLSLLLAPAWAAPGDSIEGPLLLHGDTLTIGHGERFVLTGDASIRGPGRVEVLGTLEVLGDARAPGLLDAPVRVSEGGVATFRNVRFRVPNATALTILDGTVELSGVTFELGPAATMLAGNSTLRADHATWVSNDVGIDLQGGGTLSLTDSMFRGNRIHLDARPASGWRGDITNVSFSTPTAPTGPGIRITAQADASLLLEGNTFRAAAVGLRLEGRGLQAFGRNDTFLDNGVALHVIDSDVLLRGAVFGHNGRPFDGPLRLEDATFLQPPAALDAPNAGATATAVIEAPQPAPLWPWLVGALALLVVVGVAIGMRASTPTDPPTPRPPSPAPDGADPEEPAIEEAPIDFGSPLSAQAARILGDLLDHPGSAQSTMAERLGLSRQALHYHIKKLVTRGIVTKTVTGRETHCTVAPSAEKWAREQATNTAD